MYNIKRLNEVFISINVFITFIYLFFLFISIYGLGLFLHKQKE